MFLWEQLIISPQFGNGMRTEFGRGVVCVLFTCSLIHPSILSSIHPFSCLLIHLFLYLSIHLCRYPESTRRQLEAAYLSDVDGLGVTIASKCYNIDLKGDEMNDETNSSLKWKIRRVDPDDMNYNGNKWMNGL